MVKIRIRRAVTSAVFAALGCCVLGGCSIEPWVKPYERDHMADRSCRSTAIRCRAAYIDHVHEAREGARGATGSAGGGCGCN